MGQYVRPVPPKPPWWRLGRPSRKQTEQWQAYEATLPPTGTPLSGPNTYRRHLGDKFRVIMMSCLTGADNGPKPNLAKSISSGHQTKATGPTDSFSALKIDSTVDYEP